jgi:acetyltransferase-like isoleucine patch superfamily enzyme
MIHETAILDETSFVHPTAHIWHWTHIRENASIGENVVIGQGCYIDHNVTIPKGCKIQNYVSIYYGVELEEDVFIGPHAVFTNDKYPRAFDNNWQVTSTLIQKGASIGAGAVILPGTTIGEYAMIGAGAVVVESVKANAVVVGNPAQQISFCGCDGYPITFEATFAQTENGFNKHDGFNRPLLNTHSRKFKHEDFPEYTGHTNPFYLGDYIREGKYCPLEILDKRRMWKGVLKGLTPDQLIEIFGEIWIGNDKDRLLDAFRRYY